MSDMYPAKAVGKAIAKAIRESGPWPRRHSAEVTSDRLGDAVTKWGGEFTGAELDMVAHIRHRLEQIAEGESGE